MRYVIRSCSEHRSHGIHFTVTPPPYAIEVERATFICPGDREGDRIIRDADTLADVVRLIANLPTCWVCGLRLDRYHVSHIPRDLPEPIEPPERNDAE